MKDSSFGDFSKEYSLLVQLNCSIITVIWRINLLQRINKINHGPFEAFANFHWSALLHCGLCWSDNRIWGKCECRPLSKFQWFGSNHIPSPIPSLEMQACHCNGSSLYTVTLQFQVRTNQKDRKLIGKRHRAMPMFPISLFGSGTSQAGILLPVTTIPKPLLQSKDGPCSSDTNRWSIRELYFHKQKYLLLPALLQKHGSFRTG